MRRRFWPRADRVPRSAQGTWRKPSIEWWRGRAAESRIMTESERRLTAYHEAGHAIVGRFLEKHDPVHKITIVGRGRAGGYTRFLPAEDRHYQTRGQFEASIASALGGARC